MRHLRFIFTLALVIVVGVGIAGTALAGEVSHGEIFKYGIIETGKKTETVKRHGQSDLMLFDDPRVTVQTTTIKSEYKRKFGFEYYLRGYPSGAKVEVEYFIQTPTKTYRLNRYKKIDKLLTLFYTPGDASPEPGEYSIQVRYRGNVIVRKDFVVVMDNGGYNDAHDGREDSGETEPTEY